MSKKHDKDFLMSRKYAIFVANEYAKRIEKAIEYIKEHIRQDAEYPYYMEILVEDRDELLNILRGEYKDD